MIFWSWLIPAVLAGMLVGMLMAALEAMKTKARVRRLTKALLLILVDFDERMVLYPDSNGQENRVLVMDNARSVLREE